MKVLMIHEVHDWMLDLDLSDFDEITFDDGLYSQYKHYKHFLKFGKPLKFFISTKIVCPEEVQQNEVVRCCRDSHKLYRENGDLSNYMKWSQLVHINDTKMCHIGGHSHTHPDLRNEKIFAHYPITKGECEQMIAAFNQKGIKIDSFCYPYNHEALGYKHYLKNYGITYFYGKERTPIEDLA